MPSLLAIIGVATVPCVQSGRLLNNFGASYCKVAHPLKLSSIMRAYIESSAGPTM